MVHALTPEAEQLHRRRQSAGQRRRWAKHRERLVAARRAHWAGLTPEEREARLEPLRAGYEAKKEKIRRDTSRRQRARAAEISESSRRMWARRTPEERAALSARQRAIWAAKSPEERRAIHQFQGERRKAAWAQASREERLEFSGRVSEGHSRRRAAGRGYIPYENWQQPEAARPSHRKSHTEPWRLAPPTATERVQALALRLEAEELLRGPPTR